MAITLLIDNGDLNGRVDYTRHLVSAERSPVALRDRLNQPSLLDFTLAPAGAQFTAPRRSAYVQLNGLADALPPGGPRAPGPLFTGYITNEPAIEFLGTVNRQPVYGYRCQATSEEYLLNVKRIGVLPPFLNQTAGQILIFLVGQLQPGRFDTSEVAAGALIPHFMADPERSWSEIARELAERSGYYYRVLDGKIRFQSIGDLPSGVKVDAADRDFRPASLEVAPTGNPIRNDVTVFGGVEPQAYVREYFVGDGFTSRFTLSQPIFGAESARLLADDFSGAVIDTSRWEEQAPGAFITLFEGRLNVTGGLGNLNETTLRARQAIALEGELSLVHGEYEFVAASTGILGGLYTDATLTLANCLLGFDASSIGGGSRLRAVVNGAVQAAEVLINPARHYILETRLSAEQPFRVEQTFPSQAGNFGGASVPSAVRVQLVTRELDPEDAANETETILYENTLLTLPPFAVYAPVNSAGLHVVGNFLQITQPIQAHLETQLPGEAAVTRRLGFGITDHDATITSDPLRNQWALEFYEDSMPALGERVEVRYRAAGRARARLRDSASVTAEASLAGDDGIRAAVLTQVNPAPRTSVEAELAAQAFLADHAAPRYEGRYTTWGRFVEMFPRSGRLLEVRDESRYPAFTALIRGVASEIRELASEQIVHTVEFGQPSRFEDLLRQFTPREGVLQAEEAAPLAPVEAGEAGAMFLPELTAAAMIAIEPDGFVVDAGAPPPVGGAIEVRRSDQGWGAPGAIGSVQNVMGRFTTQTFLLPRSRRTHSYFLRPVDGTNATSRFSAAVAVNLPLVPVAPAELSVVFGVDEEDKPVITAVIGINEDQVRDVEAVELRDADGTTVLARWMFAQLAREGNSYAARHTLDNSTALLRTKTLHAHAVNALGEASAPRTTQASRPEPLKPTLTAGNSVGQVLEILLDRIEERIVETQIQVAGPVPSIPVQDIHLPGQPDLVSFVASQTGGWAFRARRRDELGWSPWSDEPQGQIPAQGLIFDVHFFEAHELAPSIGAAINAQNLLPNGEFFLGGIGGQEGMASARYFALSNAPADGSEVAHSPSTNEMHWKSGVNFAAANPGFRSLLTNLGRLFNPGESLTLSAALRHSGTLGFAQAVRFRLRSPGTPSYVLSADIPAETVLNPYAWYSVPFTLPGTQAVPDDLTAEILVVIGAGQSLTQDLFCDKVIVNRGQRPAAFSLAPWDVVALAWNSGAGGYDLPATAVAASPRTADVGGAGNLSGTGTDDLDPDFSERYFRLTA